MGISKRTTKRLGFRFTEKVTNKDFHSINYFDDRNKANLIMKNCGINMVPI